MVVDRIPSPSTDIGTANVRPLTYHLRHTAKMTLSSSLSLFRRFSRKNKRQPSELAPDPQVEDVSPSTSLPQGELSSSYIIATRSTISTTTTSRQSTLGRDQQDKGERKRVAETPQEEGDLETTRKCSKKVAFNEDRSVVFFLLPPSVVVSTGADVDHFAGVFPMSDRQLPSPYNNLPQKLLFDVDGVFRSRILLAGRLITVNRLSLPS